MSLSLAVNRNQRRCLLHDNARYRRASTCKKSSRTSDDIKSAPVWTTRLQSSNSTPSSSSVGQAFQVGSDEIAGSSLVQGLIVPAQQRRSFGSRTLDWLWKRSWRFPTELKWMASLLPNGATSLYAPERLWLLRGETLGTLQLVESIMSFYAGISGKYATLLTLITRRELPRLHFLLQILRYHLAAGIPNPRK